MEVLPASLGVPFLGKHILGEYLRPESSPRKRKLAPNCFLQVWDVPASNSNGAPIPASAMLPDSVRCESGLANALMELPAQALDTIRIYIYELDEDTLTKLRSGHGTSIGVHTVPHQLQALSGTVVSNAGLRGLTSQWRDTHPNAWYRSDGWDFPNPTEIGATKALLLKRLRRDMNYLVKDIKELVGHPHQEWACTVKNLRLEGEDGQMRVFVSCVPPFYPSKITPCISTERFASELLHLECVYQPLRSASNLKQIFLLQYHHANLTLFTEFLQRISSEYAVRRKADVDPRQSKLREWNLRTIMNDLDLYRQFSGFGTELQSTIGLFSEIVFALAEGAGSNDVQTQAKLSILRAELSCTCRDMNTRLDRLSSDLEQDLRFLSLSRDFTQSRDVQTLTLLATIFLPLSLSAGVLSMQYRFHELGERLYDFFGIVILLVAIVVLVLIVISMRNIALELEGRFKKYNLYRLHVRPSAVRFFVLFSITLGLLILASFLVGMFKDVNLGARILGWGLLTATCGPIALAIVLAVCSLVVAALGELWSCICGVVGPVGRESRKKKQERDPEENRIEEVVDEENAKQKTPGPDAVTPSQSQPGT